MDGEDASPLEQRVAELECTVGELREAVGRLEPGVRSRGRPVPPAATPPPKTAGVRPGWAAPFQWPESTEGWLSKVGIGLLLFGVAFLFKYSIDQGWLTPMVRVAFGLALGGLLLGIGAWLPQARGAFAEVLFGGAIATWYATAFAAYQLFGLVPYGLAFGFMVGVTALAFALSLGRGTAVLAIIGTLGGLATPFLLHRASASVVALSAYTGVVLAGAGATTLFRGWRALTWTALVAGFAVLAIAVDQAEGSGAPGSGPRWAVQIALLVAGLSVWAAPVVRELLRARDPQRWPASSLGFMNAEADPRPSTPIGGWFSEPHGLTLATPLLVLLLCRWLWSWSDDAWGAAYLGSAALFAAVSWGLARVGHLLAPTHAFAALLQLTIAFYLLLDGNALLFTLAAEGVVLHALSRRLDDPVPTVLGHTLFAFAGIWTLERLFGAAEGTPLLNAPALTDLEVIGLALVASAVARGPETRRLYPGAALVAMLGLLWRELGALPDGEGYVTIAWGALALVLVVAGLRRDHAALRAAGLATLAAVVVKLFLIDLARVPTLWRILSFLGFGALFLALGYWFRALWKPEADRSDATNNEKDSL